MVTRMELVAGSAPDILVLIGTDDRDAMGDRDRFEAYLSLGGGMDPTWLDLFADAVRTTTELSLSDFLDARIELGPTEDATPTVERIDPAWISAVATIPERSLDSITGRWIDRLEEELGPVASDEKPWIRELAGRLVVFCRDADRAPDVVFLWEL
ncbi:MAG: hypothetical protein ACRDIL_21900 [Candidatus Limnocylindrales bacterium]